MPRRPHSAARTALAISPQIVDTASDGHGDAGWRPSEATAGDTLTVLRVAAGHIAAKAIRASDGGIVVGNYDAGAKYTVETVAVAGIHALADVLTGLAADSTRLLIRGQLGVGRKPAKDGTVFRRKIVPGSSWRGYFEAVARRWVCIDIDEPMMMPDMDMTADPETVVRYALALLGAPWRDASVFWQGSSRAGLPGVRKIKLHLWFWLDERVDDARLRAKFRQMNKRDGLKVVDEALADAIQIHYTAAPLFVGMTDPLPHRCGLLPGATDAVAVELLRLPAAKTTKTTTKETTTKRTAVCRPEKASVGVVIQLPTAAAQATQAEAVASAVPTTASITRLRPRTGLYQSILDDVHALARHRHGAGGVGDGERDRFFFAAAAAAANVHPGRIAVAARELADLLVPGKGDEWIADKLSALSSRVARHLAGERISVGGREASPIYSPSVAWFINFLAITESEMLQLDKLISETVSRRRRRGLKPIDQRRADERERTEAAAVIAAELYSRRNMSATDAAKILGVCDRRFWALLQIGVGVAESESVAVG